MKKVRAYDGPSFWLEDRSDLFPLRRVEFAAHGWRVVKDIVIGGTWGIVLFEPFKEDGETVVRGCVSDGFHLEYPTWRWDSETTWKNPRTVPYNVKIGFARACKALSKAY